MHDLLASVYLLSSLSRLEVYVDQLEERVKANTSRLPLTKLKNLISQLSSSIIWHDLSSMLPGLSIVAFGPNQVFENVSNGLKVSLNYSDQPSV